MNEQEQPRLNVDEKEISLIKATFAENDELLKAMRALAFGLPVSDTNKETIKKTFANDELVKIMRKRLVPQLDADAPIGQVADVWLGVEQMIFNVPRDTVTQAIKYKARAVDMTKQALELFIDPSRERISLDVTGVEDELGINILARNQYIRHIESQLLFLKMIAGTKDETPDEAKKRLTQDSAQ